MSFRISVEGDNASHYSSRLHEENARMPDPTAVREVQGNRTETAAARVTVQLQNAARRLASHTKYVRAVVVHNADALTETVTRLQETDGAISTGATQGSAIIDDIIVSDTAPPSASSVSSPSAAPPSSAPAAGGTLGHRGV